MVAAAAAVAGVNHQGAEESRVCISVCVYVWVFLGGTVSISVEGGEMTPTRRNGEKAKGGEHPICDFWVGEEEEEEDGGIILNGLGLIKEERKTHIEQFCKIIICLFASEQGKNWIEWYQIWT